MDPDELHALFSDDTLPLPARLDAAREMIRLLESTIADIRSDVHRAVAQAPPDPDLIATLYWDHEDLVPVDLLGTFHRIREIVEPRCPWTYPCPTCGADQRLTSRDALKNLRRAIKLVEARPYELKAFRCTTCREQETVERAQQWQAQEEAHRRRLHELKTMPYREYLLTEEWQERRKARLRAARYACQVCNKRNTMLNVHHRTYERRGEELARDLVVLCEGCHLLFHRTGSLAPHDADVAR